MTDGMRTRSARSAIVSLRAVEMEMEMDSSLEVAPRENAAAPGRRRRKLKLSRKWAVLDSNQRLPA